MSKADQLGAGRFGGGVRPVSARRQAVAAATGVPTEGVAPPTKLPPDRISLNPDNPRSSLGDLTDLANSLKDHGQKVAITIMTREAYVGANPSKETELEPDTTYVVVDGSSRLAAAREAGLATVKVMVDDDQGDDAESILESALVANIHRQDLDEIDEARALQRLLAIHGSQRALAKRLHRSQGWVSQRLALLSLTPELQARIGEEPIDLLRAVGNKPAHEQEEALAELKAERARKEEERGRLRKIQQEETAEGQGDSTHTPPEGDAAPIDASASGAREGEETSPAGDYDVITDSADTALTAAVPAPVSPSEAIPEPRLQSPTPEATEDTAREVSRPRQVPYGEPGPLAMLLDAKIPSDEIFFDLLRFLGARGLKRNPARLGELARSLSEQVTAKVD
ncbi:ParB/RepB/Spo0J family partition protein [Streptomyces sp. TG1A-8]|uniref:ParB/RepB/Spo0J family partition protein n=1 Tax=Streptomyces sp. TG1A-8 TaxID=3051385 RepID=UPI00265C6D0F|nr:ParB/RepB/Spo0J family partition protein [Streptomyces sp. TG1A-8]MDO0929994.1 ParB/RepB/Spo0J family partition protein [Streptomyces sp. TG1A-8]